MSISKRLNDEVQKFPDEIKILANYLLSDIEADQYSKKEMKNRIRKEIREIVVGETRK